MGALLVFGDTLLENFSDDEIATMLASELAHPVHNDLPLGIVIESLTTLIGLWLASLVLEWDVDFFGLEGVWDIAGFPLFALMMRSYGLVTMLLGNSWSR